MDAQNDKNNRSDDDSCPGHTVPPTDNYGPEDISGNKISVTHPDTLSNNDNPRAGPAILGRSKALHDDHTVTDGASGAAAITGVRSGIQPNFSASDTLDSKSRGLNSGTSGSSSDLEPIADDRDNRRVDRSNFDMNKTRTIAEIHKETLERVDQRSTVRRNQTLRSDFDDMPILVDQDRRPCTARDLNRIETQRYEPRQADRDIRLQALDADTELNSSMYCNSPPLMSNRNMTTLKQSECSRPDTPIPWSQNKQNLVDRRNDNIGSFDEGCYRQPEINRQDNGDYSRSGKDHNNRQVESPRSILKNATSKNTRFQNIGENKESGYEDTYQHSETAKGIYQNNRNFPNNNRSIILEEQQQLDQEVENRVRLAQLNERRCLGIMTEDDEIELCEYVFAKLQSQAKKNDFEMPTLPILSSHQLGTEPLRSCSRDRNRRRSDSDSDKDKIDRDRKVEHKSRSRDSSVTRNRKKGSDSDSDKESEKNNRHKSKSRSRDSSRARNNRPNSDSDEENERSDKRRSRSKSVDSRRVGFTHKGIIKPLRYNGNSPWETFLIQFENASIYNDWNRDDKLHQLKGCLEGQAAQTMAGLDKDASYVELCEELKLCFGVEGNETQAEAQLRLRKRGKNEKLQDLYQDIQRLVLLAYPGNKSELRDRLAVEAFTSSLNDRELELRVRDKSTKDLLTCLRTAQTLEANQRIVNGDGDKGRGHDRKDRDRDIQARVVNVAETRTEEKESKLVKELGELIAGLKGPCKDDNSGTEDNNNSRSRNNNNRGRNNRSRSRDRNMVRNVRSENPATSGINENWSPQRSSNEISMDNDYDYHSYQIQDHSYRGNSVNYPSRYPAPQGSRQFDNSREFVPQWPQNKTNGSNQLPQGTNRSTGNFICFGCGEPGHMKRNCPYRSYSGNYYQGSRRRQDFDSNYPQQGSQDFNPPNRVGTVGMGGALSYLPVKFKGQHYEFIIDTGSGTSFVPASMVDGQQIMPTRETAVTADQTTLTLDGEVKICVRIGRHSVWLRALISPQIKEPVLGQDFIKEQRMLLDLGQGEIKFKGDVVKVNDRPGMIPISTPNLISKTKCFSCGRPGHIRKFCRFLNSSKEATVKNSGPCSKLVAPNKVGKERRPVGHVERRDLSQTNVKQHWQDSSSSSFESYSSRSGEGSQTSLVRCYGCGQFGHKIRDCPYGPCNGNQIVNYEEMNSVKEFVDEPILSEVYDSSCSSLSSVGNENVTGLRERYVPYVGMELVSQPAWGWRRIDPSGQLYYCLDSY